ncbi:MAG: PorP/SprF family type IX secretion system membrane protein [Bacteroidales bacterium]|nr:PorP/SprF family type IX secretion system membrane protein [Bacteroidales bacterium]
MIKKIITGIFTIFFGISLYSQQIPINNQFYVNKASFIPAFSGYNGNIESFLTYRQNWVGIEGAPKVGFLNINGAISDVMGFGFTALTDKTGNYGQTFLIATYSYHLFFSDEMALSVGLSPMFYRNQLNISTIESFGTQIDPMLLNTDALTINAFDIGVSLGFSYNSLRVGVNLPQTIGMSFKFNDLGDNFGLKRHYFGFASYQFNVNDFGIEPIAIVRSTEKSPVNYGGSVMVKYKERVWTNLGYSADQSVLISVGALSGNNLAISYSYEFGIGGISKASLGTHELTLGFLIKPAKNHNKYATVFLPSESSNVVVDDNITNKVAMLDEQIKKERQDRIANDERLQKQIDSLAGMIGNGNITQNVNDNQDRWLQRIATQNITFGLMSNKIFSSSFSELDKYAQKLRQDEDLKIKILVYTDNQFSESVNKQLSDSRAQAIADYLLSKPGIKSSQILFEGMGSVDPIGDNTTPEGREKNNRVEILFTKKVF